MSVPLRGSDAVPAGVRHALLLADGSKPPIQAELPEVRAWLEERGVEVDVEPDVRAFSQARVAAGGGHSGHRPDLVVVLGGDGSVLSAVKVFAQEPVPVLGIKFGRVGFLAPIEANSWREALADVFEGRAQVELRMMLEARLGSAADGEPAQPKVALNDLVLSRGSDHGLVLLRVEVSGEPVSDYHADGIILATPSGSTAYSLAAGGPVLAPSMGGIVVTPIAAHALSNRPLVLDPDSKLTVRLEASTGPARFLVDGQPSGTLEQGQSVSIQRHPKPYPLLAPGDSDPWRRLRERLGWRGSFLGDEG